MGAGAFGVLMIVLDIVVYKLIAANLALYVFFAKNSRMIIGIIADSLQKEAWLSQGLAMDIHIEWLEKPEMVPGAAAMIDLSDKVSEYPAEWFEPAETLFFINRVESVETDWPGHFIRINGWPGFLERPLLEASLKDLSRQSKGEGIMALFCRKVIWVTDIPGFLSARVLASIINEAYLSFEEGVSSKEDIDIAMKLGTNYPWGPFEWAEKIGKSRICNLLNEMAANDKRYQSSTLLKKEAGY